MALIEEESKICTKVASVNLQVLCGKIRFKPGQVSDNFVMLMDMLPTLCALTGAKVDRAVDGMSILPLLREEQQVTDNRMVHFVRREGDIKYGGKAYYAARLGHLKILQNTPGNLCSILI